MADETAYERLVRLLDGREYGGRFQARCPAHEDRNPSLSITPIEGSVLVHCHGGCETDDVLSALGLDRRGLYDEPAGATYRYSSGRIVHRTPGKRFRQSGERSTVELYRVERLPDSSSNRTVFLVEGEKDVHALETLRTVAVTAPMGAKNFAKVNVEPLRGLHVTAVVDKDEPGKLWAAAVAAKLTGVAKTLRFVEAKEGKDAADHIAAGHVLGDFQEIPAPTVALRRLVAVPASTMTMRSPEWLEELRIPLGAITLLGGREGIGKSTIAYDRAARITNGTLPGRYYGSPRSVAVIAGEDSWECVILPRLVAAGADLTRVYRVEARTEDGEYDTVSVPADLTKLAEICAAKDVVLVIVDPIISVIHDSLDTHKDREVRQALDPLARFAATADVAVLGLIHVNKAATTDPLNSLMASRAFSAVARSVLYCLLDPDAEHEDRFLFGHPKSNLGPKQLTERYHLIEVKIDLPDGSDETAIVTSRVIWDGVDERTIRDAMETPKPGRPESEATVQIVAWLANQLGAVPTAAIAAAFPDIKRGTLDKHLGRLVERGTLARPFHGHYALPRESGTSPVPARTPEAPEAPERQGVLTDLADMASGRRPEHVPDSARPLAGWAADLYDREV